jgi:hypothetical protein
MNKVILNFAIIIINNKRKQMKKVIVVASIFLSGIGIAQAQNNEAKDKPTVYISKGMAENAKSMINEEDMITYYHCATSEVSYSIGNPKVKIKPSVLGEPYYDVIVIGKDQTGEKRERKIMLEEIWLQDGDKYLNLADELGLKWDKCTAHDMPSYLK